LRTLVAAALCTFVVASSLAASSPANADEKHVIETPDYTYNEITACLSKKSAFKMAPTEFAATINECRSNAMGLTTEDYLSIVMGCGSLRNKEVNPPDSLNKLCDAIEEKLKPHFVAGGPSLQTLSLSLNDLGVIQLVCNGMSKSEQSQCQVGLDKLRYLLQNPLPPVSIDPPVTADDYLAAVKANPIWVNSPYDSVFDPKCLWLMDPMGHVVRGKDGKPMTIPIKEKPDPAHPCL
jgi:hypothetical protein